MEVHCWTIITVLGTVVATLAAYIAKLWRDCAAEIKTLNTEQKVLLRQLLEASHNQE